MLVYVELIHAVLGRRLITFGRNENLVQNQLFALTKHIIYKHTIKISVTTAAAVQKKSILSAFILSREPFSHCFLSQDYFG
jgi:hypothetical protein